MIGRLLRLILLVGLIVCLLLLFRPQLVARGSALLTSPSSTSSIGSVLVQDNGKSGSDMHLNLQALKANLHYTITLDEGSCGGNVLKVINNVSTNQNGTINQDISLADVNAAVTHGVWVDVHQGDQHGATIACGQINLDNGPASQATSVIPTPIATSNSNNIQIPTPVATTNSLNTVNNFPNTGVAPAQDNSYDNYKYPRKY